MIAFSQIVNFLFVILRKKWINHAVLHYRFLNILKPWKSNNTQKQVIWESFNKWKYIDIGPIFNEKSNSAEAEIRIGFQSGSSWSFVGTDTMDLVSGINKRTMNFGWDLTTIYGYGTAWHEISHALGFPHEHQNQNAGIVRNEE